LPSGLCLQARDNWVAPAGCQFDQGVQVGAFQGIGEPGGEPVFGGGVGLAGRPAAAGAAGAGEVVVDGGAGAFEGALN